jgi:hypothetical protein
MGPATGMKTGGASRFYPARARLAFNQRGKAERADDIRVLDGQRFLEAANPVATPGPIGNAVDALGYDTPQKAAHS